MSKYSDHKKPQFDINYYLPEVYRSDVNNSVFDMAFNRHLTKDDTQRVAGVIGQVSPNALVNRQLQETSPHRQAYQLAPTMYTKVGSVETALSFKAFLQQLQLMGVDTNRIQSWGETLQFNWVPPVNIDMLVNYSDYFWNSTIRGEIPQHFTIENRCAKARSKLSSYDTIVALRGELFPVLRINFSANQFVINTKLDDLFVDGFVFFTNGATDPNVKDRFWTTASSTYSDVTRETTITVIEPISIHSPTQPVATFIGQWWFDTLQNVLNVWTGAIWALAPTSVVLKISLSELRSVYQAETNCACSQTVGWDIGLWDDNQIGAVVWNSNMFSTDAVPNPIHRIDFATAVDWLNWNIAHDRVPSVIVSNGTTVVPVSNAIWYDTSVNELKQYRVLDPYTLAMDATWHTIVHNFSVIKNATTGTEFWDYDTSCVSQELNQWSSQNKWIHKSQVRSFSTVSRATLPILEYSSSIEQNHWAEITHTWKYRKGQDLSFSSIETVPQRIELEPIKGYEAVSINGFWHIYLFNKSVTTGLGIDYTYTFVKNYRFRVVNDDVISNVYTVQSSGLVKINTDTPQVVIDATYLGALCTRIIIQETAFTSPLSSGGLLHARIEPLRTSRGDPWRGYHVHWLFDNTTDNISPVSSKSISDFRLQDLNGSPTSINILTTPSLSTFQPQTSTIEYGLTYQELRLSIPNVRQIDVLDQFKFNNAVIGLYATPNSNDLRVYVNGVRQYGNYIQQSATGVPDYTMIGSSVHTVGPSIPYVTSIIFDQGLKALDVVRMEFGSASFTDMGYESVPVRTIENEITFATAVANHTQPVYISLSRYILDEQAKTNINQYPLFNVYDLITGNVVKISPVFAFREDTASPINSIVSRRIVSSDDQRDFDFEQFLLDRDDNILYGYRDLTLASPGFWFSPLTNVLQYWDGNAWTQDVPVDIPSIALAPITPHYQIGLGTAYETSCTTLSAAISQLIQLYSATHPGTWVVSSEVTDASGLPVSIVLSTYHSSGGFQTTSGNVFGVPASNPTQACHNFVDEVNRINNATYGPNSAFTATYSSSTSTVCTFTEPNLGSPASAGTGPSPYTEYSPIFLFNTCAVVTPPPPVQVAVSVCVDYSIPFNGAVINVTYPFTVSPPSIVLGWTNVTAVLQHAEWDDRGTIGGNVTSITPAYTAFQITRYTGVPLLLNNGTDAITGSVTNTITPDCSVTGRICWYGYAISTNTVPPAITGSLSVGGTLSVSTGTWINLPAVPVFTYQWQNNGINIPNATTNTYVLTAGDIGHSIRAQVSISGVTINSNVVNP